MKNPVIIKALIIIICLCYSCQKDSFPPATKSGEGTMGFYVDGVKWVASSNDFKKYRTNATRYSQSYGLDVSGISPKSDMFFRIQYPKVGRYQFTSGDIVEYDVYIPSNGYSIDYSLDINDPSNELIITRYDWKIISGTFSFKLKTQTGDIVSLTKGRFDVSIYQ